MKSRKAKTPAPVQSARDAQYQRAVADIKPAPAPNREGEDGMHQMPPPASIADNRTHVERLNPGDNPAAIPGQGVVHAAGDAAAPTLPRKRGRGKRAAAPPKT